MLRFAIALVFTALALAGPVDPADPVRVARVPDGGLQPQLAVDDKGTVHLIYFKGEAANGDIFYVYSRDAGATFSAPKRVNSQPGSAVATGTIRGAQIAVGQAGQVHVAWNGSGQATPKGLPNPEMPAGSPHNGSPLLYARLNAGRTAFEPQRNLMTRTFALDGGGSIAADRAGNVYVAWHAGSHGAAKDESGRAVWIAASRDGGATFAAEAPAWNQPTGACACCGLRIWTGADGAVYVLYRSATGVVNRDIYLLASNDRGKSFRGSLVHKWNIGACPMSSMSFANATGGVVGAWETEEQVYFGSFDPASLKSTRVAAAPGAAKRRKHPVLAAGARGDTLLAWTEGTGWARGGDLAWQVFDSSGHPKGDKRQLAGVPTWSFGAALARPDGGFTIYY